MKKMAAGLTVSLLTAVMSLAEVPRPEHPRPDAYRENWLSLNGEWQFEIDRNSDGDARRLPAGKELGSKIIIPFCPESKLSGLGLGNSEYMTNLWYRRSIELPKVMAGKRVLLHFGGVDYKTTVYVNEYPVGTHEGGSAAFAFEITPFLKAGTNEVVVHVRDDLRLNLQPCGKQAYDKSEGCVYTRTTGIWQPVWLEAVGELFVENISIVAESDQSKVLITAEINGPAGDDVQLMAEAFANGKRVGCESVPAAWRNVRMELKLSEKHLWAPGAPFLYDLKLTLFKGGQKTDELKSYFGLRQVVIKGRRILINGKPVFQRLILDQGFYPDGIWTAPTDEALKRDIELSMAAGYNGARLHQKVFEPRFLYWADKLGYLVWGEFPNWGYGYWPEGHAPYMSEWTEILLRDRNHPSIIGWCPFNETPPEAGVLQAVIWNITRAIDPTRPVLETSGWVHQLSRPEVRDSHDYEEKPDVLRKRWLDYFNDTAKSCSMPPRYGLEKRSYDVTGDSGIPFMISEFGGIGWDAADGVSYGARPKTFDEFYTRYKGLCDAQLDNPNLFGFCYTQLTDVEQERNGLYYYDRRPKFDVKRLHGITSRQAAYENGGAQAPQPIRHFEDKWKVLVGAAPDDALCTAFRYVTNTPSGEWAGEAFDDSSWSTGLPPFGKSSRRRIQTPWTSADIYLRKTFEYDGSTFRLAALVISHDEDTEVYINGRKLIGIPDFTSQYKMIPITEELKKALKKGRNTLAVHTRQTTGAQFIDVGLLASEVP